MPHSDVKIYSEQGADGKWKGVSTDDICAVLGETSHNIGILCKSAKINKWNKDKPYRGTAKETASRQTYDANGNALSNAGNGTGVFCGNRGAETGRPIYWGMEYPMNTAQQNGSRGSTASLISLCYAVMMNNGGEGATGGHPNYTYRPPVAYTDFSRFLDFDGYRHDTGVFLDAGVAHAVPPDGNGLATLKLNHFTDAKFVVYAQIPSDSVGWNFRDLIPEPQNYYLVAEIYNYNTYEVWRSHSTAQPVKVYKSETKSLNTTDRAISIEIPLSDISREVTHASDDSYSFIVCVGFKKYTPGGECEGGSAFVAPWTASIRKCATLVIAHTVSPFAFYLDGYLTNVTAATKESDYQAIPTTQKTVNTETLYFKARFRNDSGHTVMLRLGSASQGGGYKFRATAYGSYNMNLPQGNPNAESGTAGKSIGLELHQNANCQDNTQSISVNDNAEKTIYLKAEKLLPIGYTTTIAIEVVSVNDDSEATTGLKNCYFVRY